MLKVLTWNGEKSLLDSTENEDEFVSGRKRKWEEMDAEIDRGKVISPSICFMEYLALINVTIIVVAVIIIKI